MRRIAQATRSTPISPTEVRPYTFTGFFPPIDNLPTLNIANAGNSIPIKFSLSGFRGLNLFAAGYPASVPITCPNGGRDDIEEISPPGGSTLSYNPLLDRYRYGWQTDRRWRNTCRQLIVRLKDGTEKRANFRFR
jgi:hypothetical protein